MSTDIIITPLSLNSNLATYYFSKLDRIPKGKNFHVSYSFKKDGYENTYFKFMGYDSFEEFTELTKNELPENRKWMEILKDGCDVKECYDLDADSKPDKPQIRMFNLYKEKGEDYMISKFLELRHCFIKKYYPAYSTHSNSKHSIKTACTDKKFSVHIAINNFVKFTMPQLKMFGDKFSEFLKNTDFMIDTSIYTKNRSIRMLGNTKHGQNRHLKKHYSCSNLDDRWFLFQFPRGYEDCEKRFPYEVPEKKQKDYVQNCEKPKIILIENENVDYNEMTQLLNLISSNCSRKDWTTVAQCIYDATSGSDEGLEIYTEWSKKDFADFDEDECYKDWNGRKVKDYAVIPTLKKMAKEQNPEKYDELYPRVSFLRKNESGLAEKIVNDCTHNNLAGLYAEYSEGEIFYTSAYGWIIFDTKLKTWTWNNDKTSLVYPISTFFSRVIKDYGCELFKTETKTRDEEKAFQEKVKKTAKIQCQVGNSSFVKGIIDQLQSILTKPNTFVDSFDSKPNLFAFSDGKVVDLNNNGRVRDIVKEDYIMTTCGYPYPNRDNIFIDKMMKIIKSLSDDPEQIKSILTLLSLSLWGENKNEIFAQLTGTGGNGKGLLDTVTKKTYGNYYYSINSTQLTEYEKDNGRANSELASCRFARLVMATEPEDNKNGRNTTLKVPIIKKWTGRDPITTRFLHKDAFTFTAKFVLMMQLNDLIDLSTNDDAIKRRMKVVELPFKFVKNDGQPLGHNERYRDETLKDLVSTDSYRDAFFYILLDTWLENKGVFYESKKVKEYTSEFFESQNPVKLWFNQNYEKDQDNKIGASDMFQKFKEDNYENTMTNTVFGRMLKECCDSKRLSKGIIFFCRKKIVSVETSDDELHTRRFL